MQVVFGIALIAAGVVCWGIIVIHAFRDDVWKGILCLKSPVYAINCAGEDFEQSYWYWIALGSYCGAVFGCLLLVIH